jgi:hypothetical protein
LILDFGFWILDFGLKETMKCLACGSEALVGGTILDSSSGGGTVFKLDATATWKSLFGVGTRPVRAYGCVHCQHLQLAVDFSEKDLLKYQQFEGEQPDLLERLASETDK